MKLLKRVILCFLFIGSLVAGAQPITGARVTSLGLSSDIGNPLSFSSSSAGFRRPATISGSIVLNVKEVLHNGWLIQYGGGLGVLGYHLKVVGMDTISGSEPYPFGWEYPNIYGNINIIFGKEISFKKSSLMIGLGGGLSHYLYCFSGTSYSIETLYPDGVLKEVFHASIDCSENKNSSFLKIATQLKFKRNINLGLEYSYHFRPVLNGVYEFYHTKNASSGMISLYQRGVSVVLLIGISKHKNAF